MNAVTQSVASMPPEFQLAALRGITSRRLTHGQWISGQDEPCFLIAAVLEVTGLVIAQARRVRNKTAWCAKALGIKFSQAEAACKRIFAKWKEKGLI